MLSREAKALAARLLAAFPGRDASVGTAALYVEYLSRYPTAIGQNAVKRLIESSRFLPALSELYEELAEQNREFEAAQRPALPAGQKPEPMTDEEIRKAMAPVRAYLGKDGIGSLPPGVSDEDQEAEIAAKRERARSLSGDTS